LVFVDDAATMTVPVICGWIMQWNVKVPAVLNVRDIDVSAFVPSMSAGGLVPLSNFTV